LATRYEAILGFPAAFVKELAGRVVLGLPRKLGSFRADEFEPESS
jgi:hypothetical protein